MAVRISLWESMLFKKPIGPLARNRTAHQARYEHSAAARGFWRAKARTRLQGAVAEAARMQPPIFYRGTSVACWAGPWCALSGKIARRNLPVLPVGWCFQRASPRITTSVFQRRAEGTQRLIENRLPISARGHPQSLSEGCNKMSWRRISGAVSDFCHGRIWSS